MLPLPPLRTGKKSWPSSKSQLSDATQIICDIYSRYRFESAVFAGRENDFLPADRLCGMMLEAQKQSYGDGLDEHVLHPYMWVCKSHYYGGVSFYNFPMPSAACSPAACTPSMKRKGRASCPSTRSSSTRPRCAPWKRLPVWRILT